MKLKDCYIGQLVVSKINGIGRIKGLALNSSGEVILNVCYPVKDTKEQQLAVHPSNLKALNEELKRNDNN